MSNTETKKHEASNRKLRKLRSDGTIANGQEAISLLSCGSGIVTLFIVGIPSWFMAADLIIGLSDYIVLPFESARILVMNTIMEATLLLILPIVLTTLVTGVVSALVINKGMVFAMKPVTPDITRLSPKSGLKRIYGKRGWIENAVGLVRLLVWLTFIGILIYIYLPNFLQSTDCGIICQFSLLAPPIVLMFSGAVGLILISASMEVISQRSLFLGEQKMTETERKYEIKDQHGAAEIRQERRRLMDEQARSSAVPVNEDDATILFRSADGVIGIYYSPPEQRVPIVCCKFPLGSDADAVIDDLAQYGVKVMESDNIVKNAKTRQIGEMLDRHLFREFAAAINDAYNTSG